MIISDPISLPSSRGLIALRHIRNDGQEGVIISAHHPIQAEPRQLLRIQSSCVFSESFGSLDCDCNLQLQTSLDLAATKNALIFYMYEEGRGMGLGFKFRAIALEQKEGISTRGAFEKLGAPIDARSSYEIVARAIELLMPGHPGFTLLTNNPVKETVVKRAGVPIIDTKQLICGADEPLRRRYLEEKDTELGHHIFSKGT